MNRNLRATHLRRRTVDPMAEHDALPPLARAWACQACLPWSARSVRRIWQSALARTGSAEAALSRLDAAERATLAQDRLRVWGRTYPAP